MSVIGSNVLAGASGGASAEYTIKRSLRFNSDDSAYLDRSPLSAGNRRTWSWSGWVKRAAAGAYDFLFMAQTSSVLKSSLSFWNGDYIRFKGDYNDGTARNFSVSTNARFRDPSAWYHVVCRLDTTQATDADRIKIWVNGVEQTFSSATYPTQNSSIEFNNTSAHLLGSQTGAAQNGLDGYLADVHFIDGQALAETDFGEYDDNNVWQPKRVNITGPNNGTTWSNGGNDSDLAQGSWANVFNGASSGDHGTYSTVASEQGSGNSATITFSPAISGVIDVVMSAAASAGSMDGGVELSDGTSIGVTTHSGSPKLESFGSKTNITSLTLNAGSNGGCSISEIRLDGVPLIDGDSTNIGVNGFHLDFSDNSSNAALGYDAAGSNNWTVNNLTASATKWSSYLIPQSPATFDGGNNAAKAFDGSIQANDEGKLSSGSYQDRYIDFIPTGGIAFSNQIEMYVGVSDFEYSYNGGSNVAVTSGAWHTVASGGGTLTSIRIQRTQTLTHTWRALRVDGTILVDGDPAGTDSLIDSPANYEADSGNNGGNYCTWNPLQLGTSASLSNGNLEVEQGSGVGTTLGTIGVSSGKWYWEITHNGGTYLMIGVAKPKAATTVYLGSTSDGYGYFDVNGNKYNTSSSSYGASYTTGDVIGVALDMDAGTLTFYKNGTSQGTAFTGLSGTLFPAVGDAGSGATPNCIANFGQRKFAYTPPTNHLALVTTNLSDPTIADGSTVMDASLWTGNGTSQTIKRTDGTSLGFSPDLVWIKQRNGTRYHALYDTVRGATKALHSNATDVEYTDANTLTAFNSDGFDVGSQPLVNENTKTYVGWSWDAGTVANPVGDIWQGTATKYIGVKFASASGGTVSYGQTSGSTTVEVWTSSDNANWTQQGGTLTLSDGHTLTTSDQYVAIRNTNDATFTNWYAAATNGADGHYSSVTYPAGASWSGPTYTDFDWRDDGGVVNTDGSILSVVRANSSAGFSIVSYTGNGGASATIGHGLNATPKFFAIKNRDVADDGYVYHENIGGDNASINPEEYYLFLFSQNYGDYARTATYSPFNDTAPNSTVFSVGTEDNVNALNEEYIAYCWTSVEGYSAMGFYVGSSSLPFIYTGFRPKFIMVKSASTWSGGNTNWAIYDTSREGYNVDNDPLLANKTTTEATTDLVDILSNGFKVRAASDYRINVNNITYVYIAFAEHPFKTARAR